jgi:uncharacterized membrane protein YvbJ
MKCPKCFTEHEGGKRFCTQCGTQLPIENKEEKLIESSPLKKENISSQMKQSRTFKYLPSLIYGSIVTVLTYLTVIYLWN